MRKTMIVGITVIVTGLLLPLIGATSVHEGKIIDTEDKSTGEIDQNNVKEANNKVADGEAVETLARGLL